MSEEKTINVTSSPQKENRVILSGFILPKDLLTAILNLVDKHTVLQAVTVNKAWREAAMSLIFAFYNAQMPHAVSCGYFLKTLYQDFLLTPTLFFDALTDDYFAALFRRYMREHFNEPIKETETLLTYTEKSSQNFLRDVGKFSTTDVVVHTYVAEQSKDYPDQIARLFHPHHIKFFLDSYDATHCRLKLSLTADGYASLIGYLNLAKKIESFLTTLVLFNKLPNFQQYRTCEALKNLQWTNLLLGSGLAAICNHKKMKGLLETIISGSITPRTAYPKFPFLDALHLILNLKPTDLLACMTLENVSCITEALQAKQFRILALVCGGTLAGDNIIFRLLDWDYENFLKAVDENPDLTRRLKNPIFLNRLVVSDTPGRIKLAKRTLELPLCVAEICESDIEIIFRLAYLADVAHIDYQMYCQRRSAAINKLIENCKEIARKTLAEQKKPAIKAAPLPKHKDQSQNRSSSSEEESSSAETEIVQLSLEDQFNYVPPSYESLFPLKENFDGVDTSSTKLSYPPPPVPPSRLPEPPITESQKKPFDWLFWLLLGLLVLAGSGFILSLAGIFEVPSALSIIQALSEFFGNCSVTNMNMGLLIGSILVGVVSGVSLLIKTCCRGSGESTTNNYNPETKNPWEHTGNTESPKQLYPTAHPLQTKPEKSNPSTYTPTNSSQTTNNLNSQHTFN